MSLLSFSYNNDHKLPLMTCLGVVHTELYTHEQIVNGKMN